MSLSSNEKEDSTPEEVATRTGPVLCSVTAASSKAAAERREREEDEEASPPPPTPVRESARGFLHLACTYRAPGAFLPFSPSTATTACEPVAGSSQTPVAVGEEEEEFDEGFEDFDDDFAAALERAEAGTSSTSTGGPPDATSYRSR